MATPSSTPTEVAVDTGRRRLASRYLETLRLVATGTVCRDPDYVYRRNYGLGRVCDTVVYYLEHRDMVTLHRDGTVSPTPLGLRVLHTLRNTEEEVDADHSRGTERCG